MVNGRLYPRRFNKGFGSKFRVGSRVQQETTEEGQRTHRPKHCDYNNLDNSPNTLNDKNYQASSHKFWWMIFRGQSEAQSEMQTVSSGLEIEKPKFRLAPRIHFRDEGKRKKINKGHKIFFHQPETVTRLSPCRLLADLSCLGLT